MNFDIKPYKQRGMTCAIACMLMVLEYYKIIPKATWKEERKYYRIYRSKYMDGVPLSALAWHFAKNGLETEIIHKEKNLFTNSKHTIEDSMFDKALEEYVYFLNIAKEKGTKVFSNKTINSNTIKEFNLFTFLLYLTYAIELFINWSYKEEKEYYKKVCNNCLNSLIKCVKKIMEALENSNISLYKYM